MTFLLTCVNNTRHPPPRRGGGFRQQRETVSLPRKRNGFDILFPPHVLGKENILHQQKENYTNVNKSVQRIFHFLLYLTRVYAYASFSLLFCAQRHRGRGDVVFRTLIKPFCPSLLSLKVALVFYPRRLPFYCFRTTVPKPNPAKFTINNIHIYILIYLEIFVR